MADRFESLHRCGFLFICCPSCSMNYGDKDSIPIIDAYVAAPPVLVWNLSWVILIFIVEHFFSIEDNAIDTSS